MSATHSVAAIPVYVNSSMSRPILNRKENLDENGMIIETAILMSMATIALLARFYTRALERRIAWDDLELICSWVGVSEWCLYVC
jgi:hypothetical protein